VSLSIYKTEDRRGCSLNKKTTFTIQTDYFISDWSPPETSAAYFGGMKNRAVNVCLVKSDINITLERLFPQICLSEAFHSAWLMRIEFASKLNATVEGTTWGLDSKTYHVKNLNRLKMEKHHKQI